MSKLDKKKLEDGPSTSKEERYYIERIVDKRKKNGAIEYLIKWKGYPESANTWEPDTYLNSRLYIIYCNQFILIVNRV